MRTVPGDCPGFRSEARETATVPFGLLDISRARGHLQALRRLDDAATRDALSAEAREFLDRLRDQLHGALHRVQRIGFAGESATALELRAELEWLCNQCEHWLAPAPACTAPALPAVTDAEHIAVAALWRLASLASWLRGRPRAAPRGSGATRLVFARCGEWLRFAVHRCKAAVRKVRQYLPFR